jgi:NTE family protein
MPEAALVVSVHNPSSARTWAAATRELLESCAGGGPRTSNGSQPDMTALTAVRGLGRVDEIRARAEIGRMALEAKTAPEAQWVAAFAEYGWNGWPDKELLVTAVDCESGQLRAFDRASGVPIERAVAASCAVPGIFPPVTIEGRRYTDGGVRSGTSADLAQTIEPDIALVIAPMGASNRGIGPLVAKQLAREKGELEAVGAKVVLVQFDEAAKQAAGMVDGDRPRCPPPSPGGATAATSRRTATSHRATMPARSVVCSLLLVARARRG